MYNALVYILSVIPSGNIAVAVIILTVIVKIILLPLSKKMFLSQVAQKRIQPQLRKIQEEYKDNKQVLGLKMMELYKQNNLNPFSSILLLFIQIPIVFALYFVFSRGGLPVINGADLYGFVSHTPIVNQYLFGVDFIKASVVIGFFAGLFQYIQIRLSLLHMNEVKNVPGQSLKPEEMIQKQMSFMMKWFIPVLIFIASLQVAASVALYWIVSSLFMISQELYFRRKYKAELLK
jgi:YidC/Oxa1 family membrane protein insertase